MPTPPSNVTPYNFNTHAFTQPVTAVSGIQQPGFFNLNNKYSNWIITLPNKTELLTAYPQGKQRNLPNYYGINNRYSDYVSNELIPYLDDNPRRPPYYMGSSTLNVDPTGNQSNLGPRSPLLAKMGAPINIPSLGTDPKKLSDIVNGDKTGKDYEQVTIRKFGLKDDTSGNGLIQKIGINSLLT